MKNIFQQYFNFKLVFYTTYLLKMINIFVKVYKNLLGTDFIRSIINSCF